MATIALTTLFTACHPGILSHGSSVQLPEPGARMLVVGNQLGAISTAITWLERQNFTPVEGRETITARPGSAGLEQAKNLRAQTMVWVQVTGDMRAPMVAVRGIDVETQTVLWSGQARLDSYGASPVQHLVAQLTCSALAAAWKHPEDPWCF